jgi:diazepam-binding inhibitor (GABA receptor modulating acyl-CoA-binding protein)
MDNELQESFQTSAKLIKTKISPISNEDLLTLYGLYKQSTCGDCNDSQPWSVQIQARQKWDAWFKYYGMQKAVAMQKYIDNVSEIMDSKPN